jgi:hypothetical protein
LRIRAPINRVGMSHSLLKQRIKSPMVFHKKSCDRPSFFVLSWSHPSSPIMPLTQLPSRPADELRNVGLLDPTLYLPALAGVADVRS